MRDPLALGDCLARLLQDDVLRQTLGQQALAHTHNYSVPTMAASHLRPMMLLLRRFIRILMLFDRGRRWR